MGTELIINASLPEIRIALMENGEIQDLLIERASGKGIVGNIYKGRVTRVLPGMQAAFVDIGLEKAAFLYVDDVFVHSEIWEDEEDGEKQGASDLISAAAPPDDTSAESLKDSPQDSSNEEVAPQAQQTETGVAAIDVVEETIDREDTGEGQDPVRMGPDPDDPNDSNPPQTVAPPSPAPDAEKEATVEGNQDHQRRFSGRGRRHRRGRRGGRYRRKGVVPADSKPGADDYPEPYRDSVAEDGVSGSDRASLSEHSDQQQGDRPDQPSGGDIHERRTPAPDRNERFDFRTQRSRDRRIRPKSSIRSVRSQVNIQDLLKEGQEVLVQVAKDPIATKGARLTCHISLPGRHLVCMPTIDHVGVSRRIENDGERRKLREYVERSRPKNLGFIVRTASGKQQSEKRIKQDIEYLSRLWDEIRERSAGLTAPALVYEDLNSVLRAIRDWVTEDIDKIIVDSRYHYNEIQRFVSHFMPSLKHKVELYHGDIPIFDAYSISTELSRALERKVWLKSGGYIVIDQAEALVAIDINTGRYVGKKNLEDTILKTNLEAVQEIAYQLRLRNCGGIIILDLIDMEKEENKQRVYRALEDALKRDRARPTIMKISDLGLIEMTRKRTRDTMVRTLCESCTHCEGKGFIKGKQTVAYEVLREVEREGIERDVAKILVQAHPDVIDILAIDERDTLDQIERRYRKQVYLQAITDFHPEQFEVIGDKRSRREHHEVANDRSRGRDRSKQFSSSGSHGESPMIIPVDSPRITEQESPSVGESPKKEELERVRPVVIVPRANPGAHAPQDIPGGDSSSLAANERSREDGFYDEEDRLAFLRAQAAQDAALARLRNTNEAPTNRISGTNVVGSPRGRNNNRSRGRRNHTGGGRFRRGDDRDRGGRYSGGGHSPRIEPQEIASTAPSRDVISPVEPPKKEIPDEGSGDSSQPPV